MCQRQVQIKDTFATIADEMIKMRRLEETLIAEESKKCADKIFYEDCNIEGYIKRLEKSQEENKKTVQVVNRNFPENATYDRMMFY